MATYVNNLRLKEIATGAESGTWGTSTNTNLELIADAFGSGTEAITTNADTHTTTVADGAADEGRAIYMKYTGTLDSACTITLAPNTINKFWIIENATSGSQNIIISQGSGANITIGNGNVSAIFTDGAGGGAAVLDAFADLELSSTLTVAGNVDFNGDLDVDGTTNLDIVDIDGAVDMASTLTLAGNADFNGDLDVDGTTNLDVVDIDGAVDMASTLGVTGVTTHGGNVVSDTDSTDDLGTTGVRWANLWVDAITMGGTLAGAVATFSSTLDVTGNVGLGADSGTGIALEVSELTADTDVARFSYTADDGVASAKGLRFWNKNTTSATDGGLTFSMSDNGGIERYAGAITVDKVGTWTSTASTRDSQMRFSTAIDGVIAERFRIKQTGVVNFTSAVEMASTLAVTGTSTLTGTVGIGQAAGSGALEVTGGATVQGTAPHVIIKDTSTHSAGADTGAIYMQGLGSSGVNESLVSVIAQATASRYSNAVVKLSNGSGGAATALTLTGGATPLATFPGDIVVSGTGPHAIGGAADATERLRITGDFTSDGSSAVALGTAFRGTITGADGDTTRQVGSYFSNSMTTASNTETVAVVAQAFFEEPDITKGDDTVTLASTVYIRAAPSEGETNAALYVASGTTHLGGDVRIPATNKFYFDGGSNTYMKELSADVIAFYAGGDEAFKVGQAAVMIPATNKLYFDAGGDTYIQESSSNALLFQIGGAERLKLVTTGAQVTGTLDVSTTSTLAGTVYIGETANANATLGLTINQGAADNEILACKSSDVAHGMTGITETDTYMFAQKDTGTGGGYSVWGLKDTEGAAGSAIHFTAAVGEEVETAKSTAALGCFTVTAYVKSGTSVAAPGTDGNLMAIRSAGDARFIFDAEGSAHAEVEWTTFDQHNDLQLLEDLETHLAPTKVQRVFGEVIKHDRDFFEDEGLFHDIRDVGDGHVRGMMNQTKMIMLHSGAIRQVGGRQMLLENCLRDLVAANPTLVGGTEALALLEEN